MSELPFEPTIDISSDVVAKQVDLTPDWVLEQKSSDCCNALMVHGEGGFRCSMCGRAMITVLGGVHPDAEPLDSDDSGR